MMTLDQFAELVRETVPTLKRRGHEWHGLCPFHLEKTPSLQVFNSKVFEVPWFHCQGCHESGSPEKWMNRFHGGRKRFVPAADVAQRFADAKPANQLVRSFFDAHPDASPEWEFIIRSPQEVTR